MPIEWYGVEGEFLRTLMYNGCVAYVYLVGGQYEGVVFVREPNTAPVSYVINSRHALCEAMQACGRLLRGGAS